MLKIKTAALTLATLLLAGCTALPGADETYIPPIIEQEVLSYNTIDVTRGDISDMVIKRATFQSIDSYALSFPDTGGFIAEFNATSGKRVSKGDVLASFDTEDTARQIAEQEITLRLAEIDYEDALRSAGLSSESSGMLTRAPFAGTLLDAADLKTGDKVSKGAYLGRLVDDSEFILSLYFSYAYENDISRGQSCTVSLPDILSTVQGTVIKVDKVRRVDPDGGVSFRADIKIQNPGALTEDMSATAVLTAPSGETILPISGGTLKYGTEQEILSEGSGEVKSVSLASYRHYTKGETLLSLDMVKGSANSTVERAALFLELAQMRMDRLRKQLERTVLISPIDGIISYAESIRKGDWVDARRTLAVVDDDTKLYAVITALNQEELLDFTFGLEVTCEYMGKRYKGTIVMTPDDAPKDSQSTPQVLIELNNPPDGLEIGDTIQIMIIRRELTDVIVIPSTAISKYGTSYYVQVLDSDGTRRERRITIGAQTSAITEVTGGLTEGEKLIVK